MLLRLLKPLVAINQESAFHPLLQDCAEGQLHTNSAILCSWRCVSSPHLASCECPCADFAKGVPGKQSQTRARPRHLAKLPEQHNCSTHWRLHCAKFGGERSGLKSDEELGNITVAPNLCKEHTVYSTVRSQTRSSTWCVSQG